MKSKPQIHLYNTLAKRKEPLKPIRPEAVSIYTCGPTVYDRAQIGNLAAFVYADTLRRAIATIMPDHKVTHVMNITDVDDKTIRNSLGRYPDLEPHTALNKLTKAHEAAFMEDMAAVGADLFSIKFVRATESIGLMQTLIRKLFDAGLAYRAEGGIYFSIDEYGKRGRIYGQLVEVSADSTASARIANDEYDKNDAHDFALWKLKKPGEPAWDFVIDGKNMAGRPGWHIECSAMSTAELGLPFDIHTGGVDLKFPHHENEIAQSTAVGEEKLLAKIFFHNEHLLVDGRKMSKSLNNYYTLEDVVNKNYSPLALRLRFLESHYRSRVNFTWESLEAARNRLQDLQALADLRWQTVESTGASFEFEFEDRQQVLLEHLANDLDTPTALAAISEDTHLLLSSLVPTAKRSRFLQYLQTLDRLLGLKLLDSKDVTARQKQLIIDRETARQMKDWNKADSIRQQLLHDRVEMRDMPTGPIWWRRL